MARKRTLVLPATGAAFAFPLDDGRFSTCRVLLGASSEPSTPWNGLDILAVSSAWIGEQVPAAEDPSLRRILYLTHHAWRNEPNMLWISEALPAHFISIGEILPTPDEQAMSCVRFGRWNSLTAQPLAQWRWDNERDGVIAEDALKAKEERGLRAIARRKRDAYLRRITLDKLRARRFFSQWKDGLPAEAIHASRSIMTSTVEQLLKLRVDAPKRERMTILRQCIESFNALDADMSFIDTVEREDICEEFEAIAHACGLGALKDLADRWRDW